MGGILSKCTPISRCEGMTIAIRGVPENFEGKGLSIARGWVGEEARPRVIGIVYREKARADGLLLNFCPWCGADIRASATPEVRS